MGGTGAMGIYLAPELLKMGYEVHVTTRQQGLIGPNGIRYIRGDAHDPNFIKTLIRNCKYDCIVDFMIYSTNEFKNIYSFLVKVTDHYIFLSSYRVFNDDAIITEKSPRLLDTSNDNAYLQTDEYALSKARQEDILRTAQGNWTIVRPAITYSKTRFQLGVLEADSVIWRALNDMPVIFPKEMLIKKTTLTWAGDVARVIAKIVLNKKAFGEDYNIATNEYRTWKEICNIYESVLGIKILHVSMNDYLTAVGRHAKYQIYYDRMFNRRIDNSKVLQTTNVKQASFRSLDSGLKKELENFIENPKYSYIDYAKQARIDRLTGVILYYDKLSPEERSLYLENRFPFCHKLLSIEQISRNKIRLRTRLNSLREKAKIRTRIRHVVGMLKVRYRKHREVQIDGAIVTLTGYYNYGSIIQRWALQTALGQKGKKFIVYSQSNSEPIDDTLPDMNRYVNTASFVKSRIQRKEFDINDNFSTYIVGSDQVWRNWNYNDENQELGYFFLNFVSDLRSKRIAYAASFGQEKLKDTKISKNFIKYAFPLMDRFDAISVREESARNIVKHVWQKDSKIVADPTMLLKKDEYSRLINDFSGSLTRTAPVFIYMLATDTKQDIAVNKIIKSLKKSDVEKFYPRNFAILPPVEQWLKGFRDAETVITDSFHGTVFAIINNTPFFVIGNEFGGVSRLKTLLRTFGLEDRLILLNEVNDNKVKKISPINWRDVNIKLTQIKLESESWLIKEVESQKEQKKARVVAIVSYKYDKDLLSDLKSNLNGLVDDFLIKYDKNGDLMKHEGKYRRKMIESARSMGADWVVALDPDERFEKSSIKKIRQLVDKHLGEKMMFEFNFRELYTPREYRIDGIWGDKKRIAVFPVRDDNIFTDLKIHAPKNPLNNDYTIVKTGLNIYHFKHIRPDLRKQRRDLYTKLDPHSEAQDIGYDYLIDEEKMELESIPRGRDYAPVYRDYIIDKEIFNI